MATETRIAGAPISWGVCEVPGWGPMLPADRVLRELRSLGLDAIELGSPGFLPDDGADVKEAVASHGVDMIGGFVPLVLHRADLRDATIAEATEWARKLAAGGGTYFITAVVVDSQWAPRIALTEDQWSHLIDMLGEVDRICAEHGLVQALHPHVGTLVETAADVQFVLDHSPVGWCLDTGHLAVGGYDPVDFATRYGARTTHVHLKDVDLDVAKRLNSGELSLKEAVFAGLFKNLGQGQVDIAGTIRAMESGGYNGWYVLEQDTSIVGDAPPEGSGPVDDIAVSVAFVRSQLAAL